MRILGITILSALLFAASASAETIELKNGDKITGTVIERTDKHFVVATDAMGKVTVDRAFVVEEQDAAEDAPAMAKEPAPEPKVKWERKISLGFSRAEGNSSSREFRGELFINRKGKANEATFKLTGYTASSNGDETDRKFYGMGRYAYSFGRDLKWYHFFKMEWDQDRFANIDYRLLPSSGVGYWFSDTDDFKAMVEGAFGYEYTNYRGNAGDDGEAVFVGRGFLEKSLTESLKIREDMTLYPSLSEFGEFRLRSESALINALTEKISLKLSLIEDYNSNPSGSTEKNDYRVVTSLEYNF